MLRRIGFVMLVIALACPAAASAGGYATVGLQSLPTDVEAGKPWMAEFTVLAHGRTPFVDGKPSVTVHGEDGSIVGTYPARLAGKDGLYRAAVEFPSSGRFEYVIDDGYSKRHTFPPVIVGSGAGTEAAAAPAPTGDDELPLALALAAGAGLLTAWLVMIALSRRRTTGGEPALEG